jgi:hypothetical protein
MTGGTRFNNFLIKGDGEVKRLGTPGLGYSETSNVVYVMFIEVRLIGHRDRDKNNRVGG